MLWQLVGNRDPDLPPVSPLSDGLESLARELFLPVGFLERIMELLEDKKQVILQGPPGTGKTYVAQNLAKLLSGDEGALPGPKHSIGPRAISPVPGCAGGFVLQQGTISTTCTSIAVYRGPKKTFVMGADVESTGMEQADISPEDLRLLGVLQQLVEDGGRMRAATALGVNYRTVVGNLEAGRLSRRMRRALQEFEAGSESG